MDVFPEYYEKTAQKAGVCWIHTMVELKPVLSRQNVSMFITYLPESYCNSVLVVSLTLNKPA